jgi:5'(3')-deoxyribonucleotidase
MRIFLDLDGVMVDFVKGAAELFKQDHASLLARWPAGVYDMESVLNISKEEFFDTLASGGEDFWANLPSYPYAGELYDHCASLASTYILTAPTYDPRSLSGKMKWIHKMFGKDFRQYILTAKKEMCARNEHVLIDDHAVNVSRFKDHGGRAIMWPTPWNPRWREAKDNMSIVKKELDEIARELLSN